MIFDPNVFRTSLDNLKPQILKAKEEGRIDFIPTLSLSSYIPLVALLAYSLRDDVLGSDPLLQATQDKAIKFYGYKLVLPWKDLNETDDQAKEE